MYSLGLLALWYILKASLFGTVLRTPSGSTLWLLDVAISKAIVGTLIGANLAHGLGAAWVPWTLLWVIWCAGQIVFGSKVVRSTKISLLASVWIAVAQPVAMAVLPFHPVGVALQGWALVVVPPLRRLPGVLDFILPASR